MSKIATIIIILLGSLLVNCSKNSRSLMAVGPIDRPFASLSEDEEEIFQESEAPKAPVNKIAMTCTRFNSKVLYILNEIAGSEKINGQYVCVLDIFSNQDPYDWNAKNDKNYCRRVLEQERARLTSLAWDCL